MRSIPYITNEANANSIRKNCFCLLLGGRVLSDSVTWKTALKDSTGADSIDYVTKLKNDCFLLENRIEYGCLCALYVIKEQTTNIEVVPDTNEGVEK